MVTGGGDNDSGVRQAREGPHVGLERGHFGFRGEDTEKVARCENGLRSEAQGGRDRVRSRNGQRRSGREVERVEIAVTSHRERPAARVENN